MISPEGRYTKEVFAHIVGSFIPTNFLVHECSRGLSWVEPKGQMASPKRMNFRKIILRISRQKCVILWQKCICSLWRDCYVLYDPISHEIHVVQQFNMVIGWKIYREKTLLYHFRAEKALFKGPNFATWIFGLKMTTPPFGTFPKIHPFWWCHPSLQNS